MIKPIVRFMLNHHVERGPRLINFQGLGGSPAFLESCLWLIISTPPPPGRKFWTFPKSYKWFSLSLILCSDHIQLFLWYPYAIDDIYFYYNPVNVYHQNVIGNSNLSFRGHQSYFKSNSKLWWLWFWLASHFKKWSRILDIMDF